MTYASFQVNSCGARAGVGMLLVDGLVGRVQQNTLFEHVYCDDHEGFFMSDMYHYLFLVIKWGTVEMDSIKTTVMYYIKYERRDYNRNDEPHWTLFGRMCIRQSNRIINHL